MISPTRCIFLQEKVKYNYFNMVGQGELLANHTTGAVHRLDKELIEAEKLHPLDLRVVNFFSPFFDYAGDTGDIVPQMGRFREYLRQHPKQKEDWDRPVSLVKFTDEKLMDFNKVVWNPKLITQDGKQMIEIVNSTVTNYYAPNLSVCALRYGLRMKVRCNMNGEETDKGLYYKFPYFDVIGGKPLFGSFLVKEWQDLQLRDLSETQIIDSPKQPVIRGLIDTLKRIADL